MILHVAVPQPLRKTFDYLLPPTLTEQPIAPGMRVRVPWGKKEIIGVVMEVGFKSEVPLEKLRPILAVLDKEPLICKKLIAFCVWAADYYHHPIGETIALTFPPVMRRQVPKSSSKKNIYWQLTPAGLALDLNTFKRAPRQLEAMQLLLQYPQGCTLDNLLAAGISRSALTELQKQDWLAQTIVTVTPALPNNPYHSRPQHANFSPLALNEEQAAAVKMIKEHLDHFVPIVLDGVTGSGKTEVYLHCIHEALNRSKQILVLIPEISLTPQTIKRFQSRFTDTPIALFHSGLSDSERLKQWQTAQSGQARIIIGTRSVLFTPLPNLGLIIIDEAHDPSLKQQDNLRYSARDLALKRGQLAQVPVILGSATHTLDTLLQVKKERFLSVSLTLRAGEARLPDFQVIDVRRQKMLGGLAFAMREEISRHLATGNQVLLFLNRRGFAASLLCHDCGWTADCERCDARMTLHRQPYQLHCHHCEAVAPVIRVCNACNGENIINVGTGTERIEQYLQEFFPAYPTIRVDRDTAHNKEALENLLALIHDDKPKILIGTQMLAKGHHFPKVSLVGILNVDQGLCSPDFRATEQLAQLITQVAGRAGRAETPGLVLLQTHYPDNPFIIQLLKEGYRAFADAALEERALAGLPPYTAIAVIRSESPMQNTNMAFLNAVQDLAANEPSSGIITIGPMPAAMARRAGYFRAVLIFQAADKTLLQNGLRMLISKIDQLKLRNKVRWHVDVDPISMF